MFQCPEGRLTGGESQSPYTDNLPQNAAQRQFCYGFFVLAGNVVVDAKTVI
jgi:hypothetical protein